MDGIKGPHTNKKQYKYIVFSKNVLRKYIQITKNPVIIIRIQNL